MNPWFSGQIPLVFFTFQEFRATITWKKKTHENTHVDKISYHIIYHIPYHIISASCLIPSVITRSHFSPASSFASPWELSAEQPQTLPGEWEGLLPQTAVIIIPHGRKRIADHFVFFLNLEGFKNRNIQNHEKSSTSTSAKHQETTVIYNQIFQVTLMSSTHVCLLVIRVYLIGPSFVTFQERFRPHVIGLGHLAWQALWPSVIEPICLQRCRKMSRLVPKFGNVWHIIYPRHAISRILLKTQDFDAIDAKHCKAYQIFSNSRCFRQVEISFERNFEPADWARFKLWIVLYPNALKGMARWLLKNAWLRSDMWYFLPVHGAGGICEQILVSPCRQVAHQFKKMRVN